LVEIARKHFMTKSRRNSPHMFLQFSLIGDLLIFLLLNQQNLLASLHCKIQLTVIRQEYGQTLARVRVSQI